MMARFLAKISSQTIGDLAPEFSGETSYEWESDDLCELQKRFWKRFVACRDGYPYYGYHFIKATITDHSTGNTWPTDKYGRVMRKGR